MVEKDVGTSVQAVFPSPRAVSIFIEFELNSGCNLTLEFDS